MKKVLCVVIAVLFVMSTARILNNKNFITVSEAASKLSEIQWSGAKFIKNIQNFATLISSESAPSWLDQATYPFNYDLEAHGLDKRLYMEGWNNRIYPLGANFQDFNGNGYIDYDEVLSGYTFSVGFIGVFDQEGITRPQKDPVTIIVSFFSIFGNLIVDSLNDAHYFFMFVGWFLGITD